MRRVSQQIGWSQEAKLYYEWLVQLERLTAIVGRNLPPTTTTTTTAAPTTFLKITWNDIVNVPVTNVLSVAEWNTFFDLPLNGNPFTAVSIDPTNTSRVILAGGSNITTLVSLFENNTYIISVEDIGSLVALGPATFAFTTIQTFSSTSLLTLGDASFYGCTAFNSITALLVTSASGGAFSGGTLITSINFPNLVTAGDYCFNDTFYVTSVNLPALTTAGQRAFRQCGRTAATLTTISLPSLTTITGPYCFQACDSVQVFDLPLLQATQDWCFSECYANTTYNLNSCVNLGTTVGDDNVFTGNSGQTITITIPASIMTCNGGNPDGDMQVLQALNTVTVITV